MEAVKSYAIDFFLLTCLVLNNQGLDCIERCVCGFSSLIVIVVRVGIGVMNHGGAFGVERIRACNGGCLESYIHSPCAATASLCIYIWGLRLSKFSHSSIESLRNPRSQLQFLQINLHLLLFTIQTTTNSNPLLPTSNSTNLTPQCLPASLPSATIQPPLPATSSAQLHPPPPPQILNATATQPRRRKKASSYRSTSTRRNEVRRRVVTP